MSQLPYANYGSYYGSFGLSPGYGVTDAASDQGRPDQGEAVGNGYALLPITDRTTGPAANVFRGHANGIPITVAGNGSLCYDAPTYGIWDTYRRMDDDPDLQLAIRLTIDPILMGVWTVAGIDRDVPAAWVDEVKDQILWQLPLVLQQASRALSYGYQPFEKVWSADGGRLKCSLKPHLPDWTQIYMDRSTGRFAGLRFGGLADNAVLPPNRTLVVTHAGPAGDLYGRSKHDAAYDAYCDWQRTRLDLMKLRSKLSGILPIVRHPAGKAPDGTQYSAIADVVLQKLSSGVGARFPTAGYDAKAIQSEPRLASLSLWDIEFQDNGSLASAMGGYINTLEFYGKQKSRAWGVPEGTGQDNGVGTFGKAQSHADNSITSKELLGRQWAFALSRGNPTMGVTGWVDDILLHNFGPAAVGKVELRCAPLADTKLAFKANLMQQMLTSTNQPMATAIVKRTNMENLLNDLGIPAGDEPFDVDEYETAATIQPVTIVAPTDPNGEPGEGGDAPESTDVLDRVRAAGAAKAEKMKGKQADEK